MIKNKYEINDQINQYSNDTDPPGVIEAIQKLRTLI